LPFVSRRSGWCDPLKWPCYKSVVSAPKERLRRPLAMIAKPFDVFISHSSKDKCVASAMKQQLQSMGIRCWMAPDDIRAGESWSAAITRAIQASHVMVLICSSHSTESADVTKELSLAMRQRVTVVPYRITDVDLPDAWQYHLTDSHWMDAVEGVDQENIARLGDYLLGVLEAGARPLGNELTQPAREKSACRDESGPRFGTRAPAFRESIDVAARASHVVGSACRFLLMGVPWLNGLGWLWLAVVTKRPRDYAYAAAYCVPFVVFCVFMESGEGLAEKAPNDPPAWTVFLGGVAWFIGIAHAFTERRRVLDPIGNKRSD
jgi:hypothetical protein